MSPIDEWLKPGAIVPVTNESIRVLLKHIKDMYGEKETDIVFKTHIRWDIGWWHVDTTSTNPSNLKLVFDNQSGILKSAEVI
jgi:hypothetical protein